MYGLENDQARMQVIKSKMAELMALAVEAEKEACDNDIARGFEALRDALDNVVHDEIDGGVGSLIDTLMDKPEIAAEARYQKQARSDYYAGLGV